MNHTNLFKAKKVMSLFRNAKDVFVHPIIERKEIKIIYERDPGFIFGTIKQITIIM